MPGIAGCVGVQPVADAGGLRDAMVKCLMHEPHYASGCRDDESLHLATGWTALHGSFAEVMPVWNEDKSIGLIFSGEDFADPAEINSLRSKGHSFNADDASYLVHLYEEYGTQFATRINGWFCGLVIDLREKKVVLFNDRYGVSRIYYHESERGFYFASEAKALLKVLPATRQLDAVSLGEFFSLGCVLQDRTLFSGVRSIPGGSAWVFAPGQPVKKETYFQRESWEQLSPLSPSEYYDQLKDTWSRLLPRYFQGKERVGLSLTGGVDSRMMLAWAPSAPGSLPCYTWGGRYRDCNDVRLSRDIARICQQPHQTITVNKEFLSDFPGIVEKAVYLSDGTMDASGSIDLYVQRKAREIAPVRLGGVYGGEILRHMVMFKPKAPNHDFLDGNFGKHVQDAAGTYATELQGHRLSFTAFKQAPWYMTSKFAIERSQLTFRTPYFDNDLVRLAYQSPASAIASNDVSLQLILDGNPALKEIDTDRGLRHRSVPIVTKLSHQWQEFTFKAEYAYDYGMPQWLAKFDHALEPLHLEKLFLGRHKFHHFRIWYREELSAYIQEMLLDSRALNRSYLQGSRLEKMIKDHVEGQGNYTMEIHRLLGCEIIQRQLIDCN